MQVGGPQVPIRPDHLDPIVKIKEVCKRLAAGRTPINWLITLIGYVVAAMTSAKKQLFGHSFTPQQSMTHTNQKPLSP